MLHFKNMGGVIVGITVKNKVVITDENWLVEIPE